MSSLSAGAVRSVEPSAFIYVGVSKSLPLTGRLRHGFFPLLPYHHLAIVQNHPRAVAQQDDHRTLQRDRAGSLTRAYLSRKSKDSSPLL
jgi:hypothetical protein